MMQTNKRHMRAIGDSSALVFVDQIQHLEVFDEQNTTVVMINGSQVMLQLSMDQITNMLFPENSPTKEDD